MTYIEAKKLLPKFAANLASRWLFLDSLRAAVERDLCDYHNGFGPITPKQASALVKFLERTR